MLPPTLEPNLFHVRDIAMLETIQLPVPAPSPSSLSRFLSKSSPRDPTLRNYQPPKIQPVYRAEDDISVQPSSSIDDQSIWPADDAANRMVIVPLPQATKTKLDDLPTELLELIAGFVVGRLGSASAASTGSENIIRNWNDHMRHPRRKNIGEMALVSRKWRRLIQERLFRHSEH